MKEIIYLLVGVSLILIVGGALMQATDQIDRSAGGGSISQEALADSLSETIAPSATPVGDD